MSDATQPIQAAAATDAPNLQKDPETGEMVSKSFVSLLAISAAIRT